VSWQAIWDTLVAIIQTLNVIVNPNLILTNWIYENS
jgi:hypothetical protein